MMAAMRIRLDLAYDGTGFSGWATQPGRRTVQAELESALGVVLRRDDLRLTVAGRTDAGVHARGQVAHVDVPDELWAAVPGRYTLTPGEALVRRVNGVLDGDIVVHRAAEAPPEFDARFAALARRYSYRVADEASRVDPLRRSDTVAVRGVHDVAAMARAGRELVGLNDFAAFCKLADGRSTIRTLLEYSWVRDETGTLVATIVADAFCHSMVRFLIGALLPVGDGRRESGWPAQVLASRQRHSGVQLMPARGLCLEEVRYPRAELMAERTRETRAVRTLETPAS